MVTANVGWMTQKAFRDWMGQKTALRDGTRSGERRVRDVRRFCLLSCHVFFSSSFSVQEQDKRGVSSETCIKSHRDVGNRIV